MNCKSIVKVLKVKSDILFVFLNAQLKIADKIISKGIPCIIFILFLLLHESEIRKWPGEWPKETF